MLLQEPSTCNLSFEFVFYSCQLTRVGLFQFIFNCFYKFTNVSNYQRRLLFSSLTSLFIFHFSTLIIALYSSFHHYFFIQTVITIIRLSSCLFCSLALIAVIFLLSILIYLYFSFPFLCTKPFSYVLLYCDDFKTYLDIVCGRKIHFQRCARHICRKSIDVQNRNF